MKKKIVSISTLLVVAASQAFAGGFMANTNQSVAFLRNPAQEAVCSVDGAYFNPAGVSFIEDGFHIGFNWQAAFQTRQTTTTFAPFAYGDKHPGETSIKYTGETQAPFIPSLDLAYKKNKFAISTHFGITGGGGTCTYDEGLGSFESQIAVLPVVINAMSGGLLSPSYSADINLEGTSYYAAGQVNASYRILENLSLAAGLRLTYVYAGYNAGIKNITLDGNPAAAYLTSLGHPEYAPLVADKELDCTQKGLGIAPVLGIDYQLGKLNLAARFEFGEKVTLKNSTDANTTGLAQYDDGVETRADIPGLLAIGAGYEILPSLRVYASFHEFFDKQADTYNSETNNNDRQDLIEGNEMEILGGIEYDINEMFTVSAGVQQTMFNFGDDKEFVSDMSFETNSTSIGIGGKINVTEKIGIDLAFFKTFYHGYEKENAPYYTNSSFGLTLPGKEEYFRTNWVLGAGVKIAL